MDSKELRGLMEAYSEVYAPQEVDEATAMAKRGYDEAPIRQKIAKSTGGGEAADRASALEKKSTFGDAKKAKARQDLARKQRGDFRKTASSNPGLHVGQHKSDDAGVKAKQAARGAQRGALTPAEKKQFNREEFDTFDAILEFLYMEGFVETLEEAEWVMANLIDEEAIDIILGEAIYSEKGKAKAAEMIAKRSTPSGRAKSGKGANVAQIRQIRGSGRGHFDREGLGGTPMTPTMAKNPIKKQSYTGTGNKAARRAAALKNEEFEFWVDTMVEEGYDLSGYTWDEMYDIYEQQINELSDRKLRAYIKKSDKSHAEINKKWDQGTATDKEKNKSIGHEIGQQRAFKTLDKRARKEEFEAWLDEAMTNYEKNRKRAAQRAAARNDARAQGKTGAVPGVGYVTPRKERETWTDESGKTRHAKGL
jgi:hypothetical protein